MYGQICTYMNDHLPNYLCGFRKGYSIQYCLISKLEKWKRAFDNRKIAGSLLTDLFKAFDHELLIAKLESYGFDYLARAYIFSYLSHRRQRTKVNNYFSTWSNIKSGIPRVQSLTLYYLIYIYI